MRRPTILVIIVTYNAIRWAERCFYSLKDSTIIPDIFVVDNGSIDGTQQFIQQNYPEVHLFQSNKNLGFGKANNIGLQYAIDNNYDYVYLLNQDAWVMPDTIERMCQISQCHPEFGILSPMQTNAKVDNLDKTFTLYLSLGKKYGDEDLLNDLYFDKLKDIYEVYDVMAAHWLIPIEVIKVVGLFSPSFPHYGEDTNYAERMRYWGYKIGVVPSVKGVHDRDGRENDKKKKLYLLYIKAVIEASSLTTKRYFAKFVIDILHYCRINHEISGIKYIFRFIKEFPRIKKYRKITLSKMAFIADRGSKKVWDLMK